MPWLFFEQKTFMNDLEKKCFNLGEHDFEKIQKIESDLFEGRIQKSYEEVMICKRCGKKVQI